MGSAEAAGRTPAATTDELAREVGRVADRLRSLSDVRLGQPWERSTRAAAALDLAQQLADLAAGIEGRAGSDPPPVRVVPDLGVFALGDQVQVTGTDLVTALDAVAADESVWWGRESTPGSAVLEHALALVTALRTAL